MFNDVNMQMSNYL